MASNRTWLFSLPEDDIPNVMTAMQTNKALPVLAYDRQQTKLLAQGNLLTIDNQIDPTTGTIKFKALFKNDASMLFPNQFVNVLLQLQTLRQATLVPTEAIQYGNQGPYVYRLNQDKTVSVVNVTTGANYQNKIVILKGLSPRQLVVTEGVDKLNNGSSVELSMMDPKLLARIHFTEVHHSRRFSL